MKKIILALLLLGSSLAYGKTVYTHRFYAIENLTTSQTLVIEGSIRIEPDVMLTMHFNEMDEGDTYQILSVVRSYENTIYYLKSLTNDRRARLIFNRSWSRARFISDICDLKFHFYQA